MPGEDFGQRRVAVVVGLEVQQGVQQRAPLALGDAHREQEQHHVIGGARGHDAVTADIRGDDVGRDAVFGELAVILHAGTDDAELDRIEHAPAVGNDRRSRATSRPDAAPSSPDRWRAARWGAAGTGLLRPLFAILDLGRVPRCKEPVLLRRELLAHTREREAAGDCLVDGLLRQRLAAGTVHHGGRDVVRGDQHVERRRGRLGAIGLVEAAVVDGALAVADVDPRGLRQRCQ